MGVIATSFGVAAVATVAVARIAGPRHSSFGIASMLLAFWAIANLTPAWVDPVIDSAGFYIAFIACFSVPKHRWCWGVVTAFALQLLVHAAFLMDEASYWRQFALNVLFAVALICASIPGGIVGLRNLRDRWSRLHHTRAVPDPAGCASEAKSPPTPPPGTLNIAARAKIGR